MSRGCHLEGMTSYQKSWDQQEQQDE